MSEVAEVRRVSKGGGTEERVRYPRIVRKHIGRKNVVRSEPASGRRVGADAVRVVGISTMRVEPELVHLTETSLLT